jgi:hypothetical protein
MYSTKQNNNSAIYNFPADQHKVATSTKPVASTTTSMDNQKLYYWDPIKDHAYDKDDSIWSYFIENDHVFYGSRSDSEGAHRTRTRIDGADTASFEILMFTNEKSYGSYAKDRANFYFNGRTIVGADPASIEPLFTHDGQVSVFFKDARNVIGWVPIYNSDGVAVERDLMVIEGADFSTFVLTSYITARDKYREY